MGNSTCKPQTAKIMDSNGNIRRIRLPSLVSDLMNEFPKHVISKGEDLVLFKRVKNLLWDEELVTGEFYLLIRIEYVGVRVSDRQASVIEEVMRRERRGKKAKLDPVSVQVKRTRQWEPLLYTIAE